jgi:glycosyltransferase involved in cell wall biosynthesis
MSARIQHGLRVSQHREGCRIVSGLGGRVRGGVGVRPDRGGARAGGREVNQKLLFVGRTRYMLPLSPSLQRKFDALSAELDVRVLASSAGGHGTDPRFRLVRPMRPRILDGVSFYALFPLRVARELRDFRPDAVLAQGGQEAALALLGRILARVPTRVVADVHGDPATPTRLYGSPLRKALAPLADALARAGLRRADGVRTISAYTSNVVRAAGAQPTATFAAFMDLEPFLARAPTPFPERPVALFVGVLERYKAVDVLAQAWRLAAPRVPEATLHIVGRGRLHGVVERLVAELPRQTRWTPSLSTDEVVQALDEATVLVIPSRSEGLGRVVVEASCRGRGVVASRVGGLQDIVVDGETGLFVPPGDAHQLADALVRALSDRTLATRLGAGAREAVKPWLATPEEYARQVRELVESVTAAAG